MEQVGIVYRTGGMAYGTGGHGLWNRQARPMEQVSTAYGTGARAWL
jgi:hypothetical protein